MRTKKIKTYEADSMNDGICFYSKRHKNRVAMATIDEQGIITTKWTTMKKYEEHKNKQENMAEMKCILCVLPFAIIFSMLVAWLMIANLIWGIRTWLIGFSLMVLSIFIVTTSIERKQEKNAFKFHSAEHMVINAYRKLKRVPTLEEIYQYSRFRNSCGTNTTTQIVISLILMFACSFIPNLLYESIAVLLGIVIDMILLQCGFLNFLQKFTTITPTDTELLVAIAGMNVWLENEKKEKEKNKFFKFFHKLFQRVFK